MNNTKRTYKLVLSLNFYRKFYCFVVPLVAAVSASLKEDETTELNPPKPSDIVDEQILNAKILNGLLSISKMNAERCRIA
jgi:hypothetical protein